MPVRVGILSQGSVIDFNKCFSLAMKSTQMVDPTLHQKLKYKSAADRPENLQGLIGRLRSMRLRRPPAIRIYKKNLLNYDKTMKAN